MKAYKDDDVKMATLYGVRMYFQFSSAYYAGKTALSYFAPTLEAYGKREAARWAGKQAAAWGARLLAARAAMMLASIEVSIFIQGVSLLISYFEPGKLEIWCDNSAFGKERKKTGNAYINAERQEAGFLEAIIES